MIKLVSIKLKQMKVNLMKPATVTTHAILHSPKGVHTYP